MAPTEILAEQHALTLERILAPLGVDGDAADQCHARQGPPRAAGGAARGGDGLRGRHPRARPEGGGLQAPGPGGRGRAASLRRRAARDAAGEGRDAGRAGDDGDAHPAHARADAVRRPRRLRAGRDAAGAPAHRHRRARREGPAARLRLPPRRDAGGPAGLRGLSTRRGVRGAGPAGRHRHGGAAADDGLSRSSAWVCSTGA